MNHLSPVSSPESCLSSRNGAPKSQTGETNFSDAFDNPNYIQNFSVATCHQHKGVRNQLHVLSYKAFKILCVFYTQQIFTSQDEPRSTCSVPQVAVAATPDIAGLGSEFRGTF